MLTTLQGYLKLILFEDTKTNYRICRFALDKNKKEVIIKGYFSSLISNQKYQVYGKFNSFDKEIDEFEVMNCKIVYPSNYDEYIEYFESDLFPTIGYNAAFYMAQLLKETNFEQLLDDVEQVNLVEGLTKKQKEIIINVLNKLPKPNNLHDLFIIHNLSEDFMMLLLTKYEEKQIVEILKTDPYQLLNEYKLSFQIIDNIYLHYNPEQEFSALRLSYLILNAIKKVCYQTGNTYFTIEEVANFIKKDIYSITKEQLLTGLKLAKDKELLVFEDYKIYTKDLYDCESNIADFIFDLNQIPSELVEEDKIHDILNNISENHQVIYDDIQMQAIKNVINSKFTIIHGGPGTGKTTIVKLLINTIEELYPSYEIALVAPTGKAAKRLAEKTNYDTKTIHKLLGFDFNLSTFAVNKENPLKYDVVIIDEASMVDVELFSNLILACANIKKFVLIGDVNQLPSVGCGNLLADIIESDCVNTIKLTKVYRQQKQNSILELSYAILNEELDSFDLNNKSDLIVHNVYQYDEIISLLINDYVDYVESNNINHNDIQILIPVYKGRLGIDNINKLIQENLNPQSGTKKQFKHYNKIFRVNDKVMQLKNRQELEIYNGDVGIIIDIIEEDLEPHLLVKFDSRVVKYSKDLFSDLTLAYAISVHKSQGSEYQHVILLLDSSYYTMLNKNLIYTAITRTKQSLTLIGDMNKFYQGVSRKMPIRNTNLQQKIVHKFKN